jgi:hypothetical protein
MHLIKVVHQQTQEPFGRLVNVTTQGMLLVTDKAYEKGNVHQVRLILPRMIGDRQALDCEVEVRWCRPDGNPCYYAVGLQFLNLNHDDITVIQDAFSRFHFVG